MRGLREVLHATRHDDLGFVEHDHLRAGHDGLDARTTDARQGQHWNLLGEAGLEAGMASTVDGL